MKTHQMCVIASKGLSSNLATDCMHASDVIMFKNRIDEYLAKGGLHLE